MFFTPSLFVDFLLLLILLLILAHSLSLYWRGRWFVFDPINFFWVGVSVLYIQQPISYYDNFQKWYGDPLIIETLAWVAFGILFLIIGYEANWGKRWAEKIPQMPRQLSSKGLTISALLLICVGLLGWKVMFDSAGGLHAWASVARGKTDWENLSGYTAVVAALAPLGVSLLVLNAEMYRAKLFYRFIAWMFMAGVLLWMFYLGSRSRVIFTVVSALLIWYLPRRTNPPVALLLPVFFALMLITSFQQYYRGYFYDFSFHFGQIDWTEARETILPDFFGEKHKQSNKISKGIEFSCTIAVINLVPRYVDYNYGYSQLEFLTHPIPRSLWPEKRYPHYEAFTPIYLRGGLTKKWVTHVYRPFLSGPSFGYIGHWYAVGGWVVLILAGLVTGSLLRAIRSIYDRSEGRGGDLVLFMVMAPVGFLDVAGEPFFWMFTIPLTLIPLVILVYMARHYERQHAYT